MQKIKGLRVGFVKTTDNPNQAADRCAILDDLQFSLDCLRELKRPEDLEHPTIIRALWEASLISFRRSLANSQTMGPDSGGVENPFSRKNFRSLLPSSLHETFELYRDLADKMVAHRQPLTNIREMSSANVFGVSSNISTEAEPEKADVEQFNELVEFLHEFVIEN